MHSSSWRGFLPTCWPVGAAIVVVAVVVAGETGRDAPPGWTPTDRALADQLTGALCYLCNGVSECPSASCAGIQCVSVYISLPGYWVCQQWGGTSSGCDEDGSYATCGFTWWQNCPSSQGTAHESPECGNYDYASCPNSFGRCTGGCGYVYTQSVCKYDCL